MKGRGAAADRAPGFRSQRHGRSTGSPFSHLRRHERCSRDLRLSTFKTDPSSHCGCAALCGPAGPARLGVERNSRDLVKALVMSGPARKTGCVCDDERAVLFYLGVVLAGHTVPW